MKKTKNKIKTVNTGTLSTSKVISKRIEQVRFSSAIRALILKIFAIAVVAVIVMTFVFGVSICKGEGMYPRVRDGDLMLWFRLSDSYNNGEILTFKKDGVRYIGRIVAKAGDSVNVSSEGKLVINGSTQYEEIFYETYTQRSTLSYPYTVPENSYFVLGDMRTGATDSRDFGAVSEDEVDGKIITIIRRRGI